MLNSQALQDRISGKLTLPSMPTVVVRLQELVRDPNCSIKHMGQVMAQDPPIAAKVLRIANSAFYSLSTPVLDISHAATILGLDSLLDVVMQAAVADLVSGLRPGGSFDPRELWLHSTLTARLTSLAPKRIYQQVNPQEAFVAGLLHDIGKFVLFDHLRSEFIDAVEEAHTSKRALTEVEQEVFGFNHADVGKLIARKWGLPKNVVFAIGRHHSIGSAAITDPLTVWIATVNHVANETFKATRASMSRPLHKKLIAYFKLTDEEIQELVEHSLGLQQCLEGA